MIHDTRVLVVEDSRTQAEALRALLESAGYNPRVAHTAEDALTDLRVGGADLVISDVLMPGTSGFELCSAIRADASLREIPVVMLTVRSDPLAVMHSLAFGADNYVTTPVDGPQLLERIARTLESCERRRDAAPDRAIQVSLLGESFSIDADPHQILDMLASSLEDIVRANTALRRAEEEREQANNAKSEFLAMMSHDFRTPLNAIGGYADLLLAGVRGALTEAQQGDLDRIHRNQRHLLALVNDILNFARLETGEIPLSMKPVALDRLTHALGAIIEPQAVRRSVAYVYEPCEGGILVNTDAERFDEVLMNVLGNAVKFTAKGGTIRMRCLVLDGAAAVEVEDTGVGIPASMLEAIFDPFVQVDRNQGKREGVGLGLAISRKLARTMGGDITVRSELGKGSTFRVTLPLANVAAETAVVVAAELG